MLDRKKKEIAQKATLFKVDRIKKKEKKVFYDTAKKLNLDFLYKPERRR